ncbi:MAG TPA: LysM peptidoglycan-binding domain-containing protein, partial [Anaerolineales bacterium]|nr:LysM peptidoglycan-binding domain-containing protein [Anaerolineales bacterium]
MLRSNSLSPWRFTSCGVLLALIISSCSPTLPSDVYPTYDPFAPLNGTSAPGAIPVGGSGAQDRAGPTPTRAALSVPIPTRNPASIGTTPTPDPPHALPTKRDFLDQYTVQAGDTLGSIAGAYGISLQALMEANGLNESSILAIGTVLTIPPIEADPNPGSAFKIIPDSELVYGPASVGFDLQAFVQSHGGYLANYSQDVDGDYLSGVEIITRVAQSYSVNPRLLVALLEYRSGWLTNPTPQNVDYPLGFADAYHAGLYRQLTWTANNLNRGYYTWRVNALSTLPLTDGTYVPLDPTINAGTAGVQYFLSVLNNRPFWDYDVSELGFFQTYNNLFGYPFDYGIDSLISPNLTQPPMQLPFENGAIWSY